MPRPPDEETVIRVMLDINAFDFLAGNPFIVDAHGEGRPLMFTTHAQEDEIAAIDPSREDWRRHLQEETPRTRMNTAGAVFGGARRRPLGTTRSS